MESIFNKSIENDSIIDGKKGRIITIEGIDGSGKTTLAQSVVNEINFAGYKACIFNTSSGFNVFWDVVNGCVRKKIITRDENQIFHNVSFLTYLRTIFPEILNNNDFLVTDWYIYGKMVLSELYSETSAPSSLKVLESALYEGKIIEPTFPFYLDVPPEVAFQRIQNRKDIPEEKENLEMLKQAALIWNKYVDKYDIERLDGTQNVKVLTKSLIDRIQL